MKLQAKLLLGIVPAGVLAVLGLAWVVFVQLRADSEEGLLRQMALVVGQMHEQTDAFVATARANARLFASSTIVERYIRVEDEEERFELMQPAVLDLFASYRQAYPGYSEIQLLLPDGYEDTRLGRPGSVNLTEEEGETAFFKAMRASSGGLHTAFLVDRDDGRPVLKVGRSILITERDVDPAFAEKRLHGYLVVTAELPFLERRVRRERIGRTGYLFTSDADGRIVEHPDRSRVGTRVEGFAALRRLADSPMEDGDDTVARLRSSFEGVPSILQATRLLDDLLLVGVLPEQELRAASGDLARTVASVTFAIICIATGFLWILLRALVLLPLASLQRTAIAIGDGELESGSRRPVVPRADEIGSLELAFHDMNGKLSRSMAELKVSYGRIHELAYRDSLTGLANRRQFLESLDAAIVEAKRRGTRLGLLFLDLDGFKKINDLLGHDAGDELLLEVARRLRDCCRDAPPTNDVAPGTDERAADERSAAERFADERFADERFAGAACIGRLGGDEFTVLLPDIDGAATALAIGGRVLERLVRPIELRGQQVSVGSSVGVSLYPDHAADADGLLTRADTAMYAVKHETKNGVRLYDDGMQQQAERQARLETDLRQALDRDELRLAFQPQLDARSGTVVGVEALMRWHHPERGDVSPGEFIRAAEQTGLIGRLGEWVIDEACRRWREWSDLGIDPVRVAVNVSPRQFASQEVASVVEAALERHDVPPWAFELEITESCMMEATATVVDTLEGLRRRGVRIAMDDFGTGYSSLAALASLPIDTLKIDRSFVTGVHADPDKGSIMSAVLALARDLGLESVAEGVETERERAFLCAHGCDVLQGYLLSRPLEADAATEWLACRQAQPLRKAS